MTEEEKEERRRTWWLLYIADRHLALSFNSPLTILDAECHLYQPLDDVSWQDFDPDVPKVRYYGPSTIFTGVGLFEYFLPLMVILGDLIDIHHRSYHPRFKNLENVAAVAQVESLLQAYEQSLKSSTLSSSPHLQPQFQSAAFADMQSNFDLLDRRRVSIETLAESRLKIVIAYATHILHVLHILLHGSWDPISMLDNLDNWTASPSFVKCASHSVSAANAVDQILKFDPELSFMPYLFGIYLLHGSFVLLCCADKVQIEEDTTVRQACETTIRAHEVCVATLNTEYQVRSLAITHVFMILIPSREIFEKFYVRRCVMQVELHQLILKSKEQRGENSCPFTDGPIMVGGWLYNGLFWRFYFEAFSKYSTFDMYHMALETVHLVHKFQNSRIVRTKVSELPPPLARQFPPEKHEPA